MVELEVVKEEEQEVVLSLEPLALAEKLELVLVLEQEEVVSLALLELVMVWGKVEQSVEEMVVELDAVLLLEPQV